MIVEGAGQGRAEIDRIVDMIDARWIAPDILPHAQILLSRGEETLLFATLGRAREDGTPLAPDGLFRIASMTKPITSVAFMTLVEAGLVALDDPVARFIPEFAGLSLFKGGDEERGFQTAPLDRPMRMIDLLRHMSGLTYSFQRRTAVDAAYRAREIGDMHQPRDADAFIAELAALPLEFPPGTAWNYSVSTDVLGVVIERISGMNLGAFLKARIFDPLGMADSAFQVPPDKRDRLTDAWCLDPARGRVLYDRGARSRWRMPPRFHSGGAGLVGSTADYHRFCRMVLNGGAPILSRETMALMLRNALPDGRDLAGLALSPRGESEMAGTGFGLGFALNGNRAHWGGLFSTFFEIDLENRGIAIFMAQVMPSDALSVRQALQPLIWTALARSDG